MKIQRIASVPLILHDPYLSVWSGSDHLYDTDTVHWSGTPQRLYGTVTADGTKYCFLGARGNNKVIEQTGIDITPTSTSYCFENEYLKLSVSFISPLLLSDPLLVSRPCTYIHLTVQKKNARDVSVHFGVSADFISTDVHSSLVGGTCEYHCEDDGTGYLYAWMGKAQQHPLGNSGDNITIDWGYVYLASQKMPVFYSAENREVFCEAAVDMNSCNNESAWDQWLIIAFDDLASVNYFGSVRRAYWNDYYSDILSAIAHAFADRDGTCRKAEIFDDELLKEADKAGGRDYAFLCAISYRQAIAAHKLLKDEQGNLLFLSKEIDSNGCIGTTDVSYPSIPLFLLYSTEYVKGMLRPIFRFADSRAWSFDFAPHDVGRYPYAWGQVYGISQGRAFRGNIEEGDIYPSFFEFPCDADIYDLRMQMPVEECGNMLLMTAVVCMADHSANFAEPYLGLLQKWTEYLIRYGMDPGEQLCTDDFAGHLAHNANLSIKAILGIEAYSRILKLENRKEESAQYHETAKRMAAKWVEIAVVDNHTVLSFFNSDSWSLKYNLIWDIVFGSRLFPEDLPEKELMFYLTKSEKYGVPLDNRVTYSKSDWLLWCAAMSNNPDMRRKYIRPVADYIRESSTRVPFSDWYDTVSGRYCHFIARSVQGGLFMPIWLDKIRKSY